MGEAVAKTSANRLRRCHECNFPLGNRDLFCPRCGAKQRREKLANGLHAAPMRRKALRFSALPYCEIFPDL
jgi:predicted amidophosphoribosyltransferase